MSTSEMLTSFTTKYAYENKDMEYVFAYKGRTFAALVSPNIPAPKSTLIDYDFMKMAGPKLTDIQCRKLHYGGHRMRTVGRFKTTVQCVQDGRITGTFNTKALVVPDLYNLMDSHCVAGTKMTRKISNQDMRHQDDSSSNATSDDKTNTSFDDGDDESTATSDEESYTNFDDDLLNAAAQMCAAAQTSPGTVTSSSPLPIGFMTKSSTAGRRRRI